MMRLAGIYTLIALLGIFLFPHTAAAYTNINVSGNGTGANSSVSVNSQTNGETTICKNGHCTTTGGGSKTTICHNGQCSTTDNGSVNYQSADGHTKIQVNTNTSGNSVSATSSPEPTEELKNAATTPEPPTSLEPTLKQMRKDINKKVQKQVQTMKEHMKSQDDAISKFFQSEMNALQKFFNGLFK